MSNNNDNKDRDKKLFYLNELSDYKVASDDPDIRGWKVKDVDNRIIGEVDNLLVNKDTERVVYLDVEVDKSIIEGKHNPYRFSASEGVHEFINKEGENHIIIPIGLVKLNEDENFVYTDKINHKTFAETKRIKKGSNVNREYEEVVLESYNRDTNFSSDTGDKNTTTADSNRDSRRDREDEDFYKKREFDNSDFREKK
ncbi:MAG: PRC-barrel domain-containing protein [Bacteroidota bacterium]